jgi:hypothetical protein
MKEESLIGRVKDVSKIKLRPTGIIFKITKEGPDSLIITPDTLGSSLGEDLSKGSKIATVVNIGAKVEDINIGDILISVSKFAVGGEYLTEEDGEEIGYIVVDRSDVLMIVDSENYE